MKKIKLNYIYIIGSVVGAITGFLYWYYIGCTSGSCSLTSQWYSSTLTGGLFGYLTMSIITDFYKKHNNNQKV